MQEEINALNKKNKDGIIEKKKLEQEVKDFVKMLVNNNMASQMIFEMTEKEGMTY